MYRDKVLGENCRPQKPKPAPVFKMGDVVENVHTRKVFRVGVIVSQYDQIYYGSSPGRETIELHRGEVFTGHELKKFTK